MNVIKGALLLAFCLNSALQAQEDAKIVGLNGDVYLNKKVAKVGMKVHQKDTLSTGADSYVDIYLEKGTGFRIQEQAKTALIQLKPKNYSLRQIHGGILNIIKPGSHYDVQGYRATAAVRGTTFYMNTEPKKDYFCTCHGKVNYTLIDTLLMQKSLEYLLEAEHHKAALFDSTGSIQSSTMIGHSDADINDLKLHLGN